MTRNEMLGMLHALDAALKAPLQIVITGASALIIRGCISRSSNDINVLRSSEHLDQGPLKDIVNKIAAKYNLKSDWIDTRPSEATFIDLPDYKPDLQKVEGNFKYLQLFIISKADSVITKFAHYTNIRQWDRGDIKATDFSDDDYGCVRKKLDDLSKKDHERALRIELEFKSVKPDFIKTEEGFSFSNSNEVALYAKKRHGIILDNSYLKQLDDDALNMRTSYQKAIIDIDNAALDKIVKTKSKDSDYGPDL
jgi:hypothetical protein